MNDTAVIADEEQRNYRCTADEVQMNYRGTSDEGK